VASSFSSSNWITQQDASFGIQSTFLGDIDQDGFDDVVYSIGAYDTPANAVGRLVARSGRNGNQLWAVNGELAGERIGGESLLNGGRIDGDGIDDLLLACSENGDYQVRSGADGSVLHRGSFHLGNRATLSPLGDINADQRSDYLATYRQIGLGRVYVISGADHSLIRSHDVPAGSDPALRATSGAGLDDVDGDGVNDYAVALSCSFANGGCRSGFEIFSGATGVRLYGQESSVALGANTTLIAALGDIDNDSRGDFNWLVTGSDPYIPSPFVIDNQLVSGATGALTALPLPGIVPLVTEVLRPVDGVGDLNGDGREELLSQDGRDLVIVDPVTLTTLMRYAPPFPDGLRVSAPFSSGGDVDNDGIQDVVFTLGAQFLSATFNIPPRVVVISGALESPIDEFCFGNGGVSPGCTSCPCSNDSFANWRGGCKHSGDVSARLEARGSVRLSDDRLRFELRRGVPASFAVLVSGLNALPVMGPCPSGVGVTGMLTDGLRCVGGDFLRHGTRPVDSIGTTGLTTPGWGVPDGPTG
ncbi:MAG: hypothetical protein AAF368_10280, partial [Planctomycetota bacterium]